MISQCANPTCAVPFHHLDGGRLYCFELRGPGVNSSGRAPGAVYFWVCERCSKELRLDFKQHKGVFLEHVHGTREPGARERLTCSACERIAALSVHAR